MLLEMSGLIEIYKKKNVRFNRDFNDSELESIDSFDILYSYIPRPEGPGRMRWMLNGHGKFDLRSYYETLSGPSDVSCPKKSVWCSKAPKRINFFHLDNNLGEDFDVGHVVG